MSQREEDKLIADYPELPGEDEPYIAAPGEMEALYAAIIPVMRKIRRRNKANEAIKQLPKTLSMLLCLFFAGLVVTHRPTETAPPAMVHSMPSPTIESPVKTGDLVSEAARSEAPRSNSQVRLRHSAHAIETTSTSSVAGSNNSLVDGHQLYEDIDREGIPALGDTTIAGLREPVSTAPDKNGKFRK